MRPPSRGDTATHAARHRHPHPHRAGGISRLCRQARRRALAAHATGARLPPQERDHRRQELPHRHRRVLGHRAAPGSHGDHGHRAPGALADAGIVVLLAAARRRAAAHPPRQRHHRRHGGARADALPRPRQRADAEPGRRRARAGAADEGRLPRHRARQQHQRRGAGRSAFRAGVRRGGRARRRRVRARAASERQGTHRRPTRADDLHRLSARDRLHHRLTDHRRHAHPASPFAPGVQPRRRRLRLDPAAAGARLEHQAGIRRAHGRAAARARAPALLRHAGL